MPDLSELLTTEQRELVARMRRPTAAQEWFRIEAKDGAKAAEVWIYDRIGSDLFEEGTTAKAFAKKVADLNAEEILLHLNSPGGDVFDGLAIFNTLKDHSARVTVSVDGVAASAASLIAQAGDVIRMNAGSQMMIHDAGGMAIGKAADMEKFAQVLDKISDSMAEIYAARAGGSAADWRAAMRKETWYKADEAVEAGLADEVADSAPGEPSGTANASLTSGNVTITGADGHTVWTGQIHTPPPQQSAPVTAAEAARRIHAASAKTPAANPATGRTPNTEGAAEMQFTDQERASLRARFSLPEGADDDAIKAALLAPPANEGGDPPANTEPEPKPEAKPTPAPTAAGTMTIDVAAWQEREERIKRLEATDAKRRKDERDQVIAQAVADGKFPPARKEHWVRLWDADPEGTRQVIEGLARNVVPTAELGYAGEAEESLDAEFAHLFPPVMNQKGA